MGKKTKEEQDLQHLLEIAKKIACISFLGGKCIKCNEKEFKKLCIHHVNSANKTNRFSKLYRRSWAVLHKELVECKCELLCHVCHVEEHYEQFTDNLVDPTIRENKKIYLEYTQKTSCDYCGYNRCPEALEFHHRPGSDKEIKISRFRERFNSVADLSKKVKNELDKCDLICRNCHVEEHRDQDFYLNNFSSIMEKVELIKEKYFTIDYNSFCELRNKNKTPKEIAAHFGVLENVIKEYFRYI